MASPANDFLRSQLLDRRRRLDEASARPHHAARVHDLLREVDMALERFQTGTFGLCETCGDPIETERLLSDPMARFCLDHLTGPEQRALEQDMSLAARIQRELLPRSGFRADGWLMSYHYAPAGVVSGDYCDIVPDGGSGFFFAIGDVSGKGVAASMLMAHLHAMFRALLSVRIPLTDMMERASRVFCESTLPTQFATLACGTAHRSGEVEVVNAGHVPPLVVGQSGVRQVEATGLPLGLFCNQQFQVTRATMAVGDTLLLYTDGIVEMQGPAGEEFGVSRLAEAAERNHELAPDEMLSTCLAEVAAFAQGAPRTDDLTLLAIRREA
jgi:phosphoserine phosphatase RsbU/P